MENQKMERDANKFLNRQSFRQDRIFELLMKVEERNLYDGIIAKGISEYNIKNWKLNQLPLTDLISIYAGLKAKKQYFSTFESREQKSQEEFQKWEENQLKVFITVLLIYIYDQNRSIHQMNENDWSLFCQAFHKTNPDIFEYQAKLIIKKTKRASKWTQDEETLFQEIFNSYNNEDLKQYCVKWKRIGCEMFCLSNKTYFRTPKQIREHRMNHLDATKSKGPWSLEQDISLLTNIKELGRKWSLISKTIHNRTEHMVKNRFNFLMKEQFEDNCADKTKSVERLLTKLTKNLRKFQRKNSKSEKSPQKFEVMNELNFSPCNQKNSLDKQNKFQLEHESRQNMIEREIDCFIYLNQELFNSHSLI